MSIDAPKAEQSEQTNSQPKRLTYSFNELLRLRDGPFSKDFPVDGNPIPGIFEPQVAATIDTGQQGSLDEDPTFNSQSTSTNSTKPK